MKDIIFAHTDYVYDSYTDYRKLVDLEGFETCTVGKIDFDRDAIYIVSPINGEYAPHRDANRGGPHKARVVSWCLERPGGSGGLRQFVHAQRQLLDNWSFDEVWISDRYLVQYMYDSRVRFVSLGSHTGLGDPTRANKSSYEYDYIHLSYITGRRRKIIDGLTNLGHPSAPNCWGSKRHEMLMNSAFMLNIHQDDWSVIEPLRLALAAAYAMPIITEFVHDSYPYNRGGEEHNIKSVTYEGLVQEVHEIFKQSSGSYRAMGQRAHHLMTTEFGFRRQVELAVAGMLSVPINPAVLV